MNFAFNYSASVPVAARTVMEAAAADLAARFSDAVTVHVDIGFSGVFSLATTTTKYYTGFTYDSIVGSLKGSASTAADTSAYASLPAASPTTSYGLAFAQATALGLKTGALTDASIAFSTFYTFDYDRSNGISADEYDFYAVAFHELTHAMGRNLLQSTGAMWGPSDLFRFSAAGVHNYNSTTAGYFSVDNGTTPLMNYNVEAGGTVGDWAADTATVSGLRAFIDPGIQYPFTDADWTALDVIGWHLTGGSAPAPAPGGAPVVDLNTTTTGVNRSMTFTEMSGTDTGANAVSFSAGAVNITDTDSTTLANLRVSISAAGIATGDQLLYGATAIGITTTTPTGEVVAGNTVFKYVITDLSGIRSITFISLTGSGGSASPGAMADYEILLDGLKYNNTSDAPVNGSVRGFAVRANDGTTDSAAATFTVTLASTNEAPTLTTMSGALVTVNEDTQATVTLTDLKNKGNEADVDGTVSAFVVKAVSSGTLLIGTSAGTATAWAAGTNDVVDATRIAYWTAAANANGTLNAFTVVAKDDSGATSATPVQAQVTVTAVNDAPTFTTMSGAVVTANEDAQATILFTDMTSKANEADIDGTVTGFVVKAVSTGTLLIGSSAGTATAWAVGTNDMIDSTHNAYWTGAANANGTLNAFTAVAKDNGGLVSAANVQVQVGVTPVNDAPTGAVTISGSPAVGQVLSAVTTTVADIDGLGAFGYQWKANGTPIAGATGSSFTVTGAETGATITVSASYTDGGGTVETLASAPTAAVSGAPIPVLDLDTVAGGTSRAATFTEVAGTDDASQAVTFSSGGTNLSDPDSTTFGNLKVAVSAASIVAGDQLRFGATAIDITGSAATGEITANGTVFGYAIADVSGTRTVTFTSLTGAGGSASAGAMASYEALVDGLKYNHTSNTPVNGSTRTFSVTVSDGSFTSAASTFTVTLAATNDAPTLTGMSGAAVTVNEDTQATILFSDLASKGNEADVDGSVSAFVVKAVSSGTLLIGTSAGTATAWAAGTNDVVDATKSAFWTGAANANGTLNAFTVVARDDGGLASATPVQVQVNVTSVNDAPTLTTMSGAVVTANEDTQATILFSDIASKGNEADVDGTVQAFVVKAVSTGTLLIGTSAGTATAWAAGTNDVVDVSKSAFWTGAANANGTLNAFTVVAKDDGGLPSAAPVQVQVSVTSVNDAPTLTAVAAPVATVNEDTQATILFSDLAAQGNEADSDGTVQAFVVKAVSSGTLLIGTSAGTATAWAAGTNDVVDATKSAFWTGAANANGTLNAFTVVARDDGGLSSATPVQVQVNVTSVNDAPTLTTMSGTVVTANEDTQATILFSDIASKGNEADVDGTVQAFVVKAVSTGTLLIGTSAGTATAWAAGTNDVVDATKSAFWTGAANANGTLNAFTVVARDDGALASAAPVQVQVGVTSVNDAPTLTTMSGTAVTVAEDTQATILFSDIASKGNEADVDGTVQAFVVTAVSTGTLLIGGTAGTATAWAAGTNEVVDATHNAYWTGAANANGTLNAFTVVAKDDGGATSAAPVQVQASVTAVNDTPTGAVTISGSTAVGQVLTAVTTTLADAEGLGAFSYQWKADGTPIGGATGNLYTLTATEAGKVITVTVSYTDLAGTPETVTSGATSAIGSGAPPSVDLDTVAAGVTRAATFTEVAGADTGANAVAFTSGGANLSDSDSTTFANLKVSIAASSAAAGDQLRFGATTIGITTTAATGEVTANGTVFAYAIADAGGTRTVTFTSLTGSGGGGAAAAIASYEALLDGLKYNNTSDAPVNGSTRAFSVTANDGFVTSSPATFTVTIAATNEAPTLTSMAGTVKTTNEDTQATIALADLTAQGNEADGDGTVTAFVVGAVSSGTLLIGTSAGTATAWAAGTNDVVDATKSAFWTPAANANGTLNAFTVVARDDGGLSSTGQVQVQVGVTAVNDAPTLTTMSGPVVTVNEDAQATILLSDIASKGNEADIDGSVTAFVVSAVSTGTLLIGTTAGTATAWAAGTNDVVDATRNAYWTGAANANGTLNAFTVVARDNGGATSAAPVQVQVGVTPVNDAPTLTTMSGPVVTTSEDTQAAILFSDIASKGNEADIDGSVTAFVISAVSSGTLLIGTSAGTATAWAAGTNDVVDATKNAYWTGPANANGTLNAFTVTARDNGGATSAAPVQVQVSATPVNDLPTGAVTISGSAAVGQVLSAVTTTLADPEGLGALSYQWKADGTPIGGATAGTFTITATEAGKVITVTVNYTDLAGTPETVTSAPTGVVGLGAPPAVDLDTAAGGLNRAATFTEMAGADTGANAVAFTSGGTNISDSDSPTLANLKLAISAASVAAGDQLRFGATTIDITGTAATGEVTANGTVFGYAIADASGTRTITFTSLSGSGGASAAAALASYEALADGLKYNNTSDSPVNGSTRGFSVTANDGLVASTAATFTVTIASTNEAPTLTAMAGTVTTTNEDTQAAIAMADLAAQGNEADVDGTVTAFVVSAVSSGTLLVGTSAGTATAWAAGTNDVVDATKSAFWTPAANANGVLNAFTVTARDSSGAVSAAPVQAQVNVTSVNDAPTFTAMAGAVATVNEDTQAQILFTDIAAQANEADVDGSVTAFVVAAVSSGTLLIGTSAGTATAWAAGTNDVIDATKNAYWTAAANANGSLNAFTVVARDNGGLSSVAPVQVDVGVTSVNDAPTLAAMAGAVTTTNEDTQAAITLADLAAQGNEADVDGTVTAFVVSAVNSGTLLIGTSVGIATTWAAGTNDVVDATNNAYWTAAPNANGTLNAFTVVAKDDGGAVSGPPVQAQVSVTAVNDAPTGAVTISGIASAGEILTAGTATVADADVLGVFQYQWNADGNPIAGATSSTYTLVLADVGATITVTVSYTDGAGNAESLTSSATGAVTGVLNQTLTGGAGNDVLTGSTGNDLLTGLGGNDTLTGGAGDDTLNGGAGTDSMDGQDGSDLYYYLASEHPAAEIHDSGSTGVDEVRFAATASGTLTLLAADTGIELAVAGTGFGAVADTSGTVALSINASAVLSAIKLVGNAAVNTLTGTAFADTIDGGLGADKMTGGLGDDTYYANISTDVVTEGAGAGTDLVISSGATYVLGTNVENLALEGAGVSGTGNTLANTITGNALANVLNGKAGIDSMDAGEGSDLYMVDLASDHTAAEIHDSGTTGTDEVRFASGTASTLTIYAGDTGVERIVMGTGTAAVAVTTGTRALNVNAIDAANGLFIQGNAGANIVTGSGFADTLSGGLANDTMTGGGGDDVLTGGNGNDSLTGGAGADAFVFDLAPNASSNRDTITDFETGVDQLRFASTVFAGLGGTPGPLAAQQFWSGAGVVAAHDADDRIVYNTTTGALYYDADGIGGAVAVQVALLGAVIHPVISENDIAIV